MANSVIEITEEGLKFLKERRPLQLTRPMQKPTEPVKRGGNRVATKACSNKLRQLRRVIAMA